jgi:predicted metal-dependent enzyme (double-stranded beta helix superfamily)
MDFDLFFDSLAALCTGTDDTMKIIPAGRRLLEELLVGREWYRGFLEKAIFDAEFRKIQKPSPWPNEMTLKRSSDGSFVVFSYSWWPRQVDVIHDHGSWGIIGTLQGTMFERTYRRLDDGSQAGRAELAEKVHKIMPPGKTTVVLPLNEGIHQMGSVDQFSVSINIYGKSVRKGYSQLFDPERKTVRRAYVPSLQKAVLAIRSLGYLDEAWSRDMLAEAARRPIPEPLQKEAELALSRLDGR